ncbi:hypothetical protein ACP70R_019357 [Stipagrostis hirtigluma subsp. patula]
MEAIKSGQAHTVKLFEIIENEAFNELKSLANNCAHRPNLNCFFSAFWQLIIDKSFNVVSAPSMVDPSSFQDPSVMAEDVSDSEQIGSQGGPLREEIQTACAGDASEDHPKDKEIPNDVPSPNEVTGAASGLFDGNLNSSPILESSSLAAASEDHLRDEEIRKDVPSPDQGTGAAAALFDGNLKQVLMCHVNSVVLCIYKLKPSCGYYEGNGYRLYLPKEIAYC